MLVDAQSGAMGRVIALQYNPDTLTRTIQPKIMGSEGADRSEATSPEIARSVWRT